MTPQAAGGTRQTLSQSQSIFAPLGELRSIRFMQSDMLGGDQYELSFANDTVIMAVVLDPNGKILAASAPMPAQAE